MKSNMKPMFKFAITGLVLVFVSVSHAIEDEQYWVSSRSAAGGADLHEAELRSWWQNQRSQAVVDDGLSIRSQLAVRELSSENQKFQATIPEASNYDVVAEPFGCSCFICICRSRRRRRSLGPLRDLRNLPDKLSELVILGSATELKLYSDQADLLRLHNSPVARSELYTRPLDPDTPAEVSDALAGLQHAVVATLTDGRRFLVVKGNQKGEGSQTIVILADHMTDDWTKVTTNDVSQSTLGDFVKAGGKGFDALKDNAKHAAWRMMALP